MFDDDFAFISSIEIQHTKDDKHKRRQNEIYCSTKTYFLYKLYDCTCNESRYYTCHRNSTMQQTSHETKYKRKRTLKQTINVEYIVLFFVSLIRLQNRFLTKRFDLYVIMYSNDMIIHLTILRLQTRFFSKCANTKTKETSSSLRSRRMCKCNKINFYTSNELHQKTC